MIIVWNFKFVHFIIISFPNSFRCCIFKKNILTYPTPKGATRLYIYITNTTQKLNLNQTFSFTPGSQRSDRQVFEIYSFPENMKRLHSIKRKAGVAWRSNRKEEHVSVRERNWVTWSLGDLLLCLALTGRLGFLVILL